MSLKRLYPIHKRLANGQQKNMKIQEMNRVKDGLT